MPQPFTLALAPRLAPVHYHIRTTVAIQVGAMKFENELLYVVAQQVRAKNAQGYLLEITVQHAMQKAEDLMSRVVADVNQASRQLVVQTDAHGNLLRIENQPAILQEWQTLRPALCDKYADTPAVQPFLDTFGQQLAVPGSLEPNLRHKGVLGALLTGLYGYPFGPQLPPVQTTRTVAGFFNDLDLPLRLSSAQAPPPDAGPTAVTAAYVATTGVLDAEAFAADPFRRLIRDIVDDFKFPVNLEIDCTAAHTFEQTSGGLLHSRQVLRAEVPGVYYNSTTHEVLAQNPT